MTHKQLVKYKLIEEVGHGGMAVVYRGLDTMLNREVAVKILHSHLAEQEESRQRFQREAQAVAKLRHENIIEIYDYSGLDSPESYIVTEFIHGQTLKEYLSRYPISHPEVAALIIVELCNALAHAHSVGVIHRDIKPENIMIREDGWVKLTDFGIAQVVDVQRLTVTGQLLGSPAYMAPELVRGQRIDFRADIFSIGTLLYQLATSELPFKGKNPHEVLKRIAEGRYVDPEVANPIVGSRLAQIIRKALAPEPDQRYSDVIQLRDDLSSFLGEVNITKSRTELARYFTSPVEYSQQLQQQIVQILTARGKAELQERRIPQALEHFNRVLCTDPNNQEVLEILDQVQRRRRLGRILSAVGLVVVLGGVAYTVSRYWPEAQRPAETNDVRADASVAGIGSSVAGPDMSGSDGAKMDSSLDARQGTMAARPADSAIRPIRKVRMMQVVRQVEIIPTPKAVTIWLNGKQLGSYGPDLRRVGLVEGAPAKLAFRNDACCFEKVVEIAPNKIPKVLRVKLPWKPGRVSVVLSPNVSADVMVGNLVTRPGEAVEVPIPSYSEDGAGEVEVKVSAPGYATATKKVQVRANSAMRVPISLRRLP